MHGTEMLTFITKFPVCSICKKKKIIMLMAVQNAPDAKAITPAKACQQFLHR